jgi:Na+-driven multidrug efflux pump
VRHFVAVASERIGAIKVTGVYCTPFLSASSGSVYGNSFASNLTEGRVSTQLKYLTLPLVWGLMATMSLNAIETFFIAQLGREPLAALSFTFPVIMVLTSLGIGLGAGTSSAIARAIGEGDAHGSRRTIATYDCVQRFSPISG